MAETEEEEEGERRERKGDAPESGGKGGSASGLGSRERFLVGVGIRDRRSGVRIQGIRDQGIRNHVRGSALGMRCSVFKF